MPEIAIAVPGACVYRSKDSILRTLYNTGARASELCGIQRNALDLQGKQVLFHGKGRKVRTVPLWDSTVTFLATYLDGKNANNMQIEASGEEIENL